jgi:hypothetical protein
VVWEAVKEEVMVELFVPEEEAVRV